MIPQRLLLVPKNIYVSSLFILTTNNYEMPSGSTTYTKSRKKLIHTGISTLGSRFLQQIPI